MSTEGTQKFIFGGRSFNISLDIFLFFLTWCCHVSVNMKSVNLVNFHMLDILHSILGWYDDFGFVFVFFCSLLWAQISWCTKNRYTSVTIGLTYSMLGASLAIAHLVEFPFVNQTIKQFNWRKTWTVSF